VIAINPTMVTEAATGADRGGDAGRSEACISLQDVGLTFQTAKRSIDALKGIDLDVAEGEFVALLGPTGCGKSSMLRLVSDLLQPTSGLVQIRGGSPALARQKNEFGFVFQEAALLTWRTALGNVSLPLEVVGYPGREIKARCEELLASVGLGKFGDAYPHELSGGMKQRVAIVRALSWRPSILLMDEPFSALDEITKAQLQDDLLNLWDREKKTVLFVTHNISEAVYLADRVVVLSSHPGQIRSIIKVDLPRPRHPDMRETADFLGYVREARHELMT
jgi:NitT/TauT family transport system ATP-binding protein